MSAMFKLARRSSPQKKAEKSSYQMQSFLPIRSLSSQSRGRMKFSLKREAHLGSKRNHQGEAEFPQHQRRPQFHYKASAMTYTWRPQPHERIIGYFQT